MAPSSGTGSIVVPASTYLSVASLTFPTTASANMRFHCNSPGTGTWAQVVGTLSMISASNEVSASNMDVEFGGSGTVQGFLTVTAYSPNAVTFAVRGSVAPASYLMVSNSASGSGAAYFQWTSSQPVNPSTHTLIVGGNVGPMILAGSFSFQGTTELASNSIANSGTSISVTATGTLRLTGCQWFSNVFVGSFAGQLCKCAGASIMRTLLLIEPLCLCCSLHCAL